MVRARRPKPDQLSAPRERHDHSAGSVEPSRLGLDDPTNEEVERLKVTRYLFTIDDGPIVVFGTLGGVDDYLFVASTSDLQIQPVGAAGPLLSVKSGFQLVHRTCTADEPNHFEVVPFDTVVSYDPAVASAQRAGRDPFLEGCGIQLATPIDLGSVAVRCRPIPSSRGAG